MMKEYMEEWMKHCDGGCANKIKMLTDPFGVVIGVQCQVMLHNPFHDGNVYADAMRPLVCRGVER